MGYAARANPNTRPEAKRRRTAEATLTAILAAFPDRTTFEQWATARQVPDELRAHMESRLPAHLQAQGTVYGRSSACMRRMVKRLDLTTNGYTTHGKSLSAPNV